MGGRRWGGKPRKSRRAAAAAWTPTAPVSQQHLPPPPHRNVKCYPPPRTLFSPSCSFLKRILNYLFIYFFFLFVLQSPTGLLLLLLYVYGRHAPRACFFAFKNTRNVFTPQTQDATCTHEIYDPDRPTKKLPTKNVPFGAPQVDRFRYVRAGQLQNASYTIDIYYIYVQVRTIWKRLWGGILFSLLLLFSAYTKNTAYLFVYWEWLCVLINAGRVFKRVQRNRDDFKRVFVIAFEKKKKKMNYRVRNKDDNRKQSIQLYYYYFKDEFTTMFSHTLVGFAPQCLHVILHKTQFLTYRQVIELSISFHVPSPLFDSTSNLTSNAHGMRAVNVTSGEISLKF